MEVGPTVVVGVLAAEVQSRVVDLLTESVNDPNGRVGLNKVLQAEQAGLPAISALYIRHNKAFDKQSYIRLVAYFWLSTFKPGRPFLHSLPLAATVSYNVMITLEHTKTFKSFGGDVDGWARMKKPNDTMTNDIWFEIEGILQNLTIIKNGYAAEEFTVQTLQHLRTSCESSEVEQELIEISKTK